MHVWTNASYSELKQGGLQQITGQSHSPATYQLCMHLFFNWILNVICNRFFNITLITRSAVYWLSDRIQVIFHGRIFVSNLWFIPQILAQFLRSKENLALKAGNTVLLKGDLRNLNFTWKSGLTFRWKTSYWTLYELSNLEKLETKM